MHAFIADFSMFMSGRGPVFASDRSDIGGLPQIVLPSKFERSRVLAASSGEPGPFPPRLTESKDKLNCTVFEADLRVVGRPILHDTPIILLILLADNH